LDPQLVISPPLERTSSDCHCPCSRFMVPLRVAEGTTIHSLQGITVGADKQVKRLGIDFGKLSCETKMPGLSMVAQSRPQGKADFCYTTPVTLERLSVCGTGDGARKLRDAEAAFAAQAAKSDALAFSEQDYHRLLRWAETWAKAKHGIDPPWRPPACDASTGAPPVAASSFQPTVGSSFAAPMPAPFCDVDDGAGFDDVEVLDADLCMEVDADGACQDARVSRFFSAAPAPAIECGDEHPTPDAPILKTPAMLAHESRRRGKRKASAPYALGGGWVHE